MAAALSDTGKDPTLTGRTDLWATGMEFISEHPWQGVGFHAFWVKGYAPVGVSCRPAAQGRTLRLSASTGMRPGSRHTPS